jgi:uncharacterized protein YegL
MATVNYSFEDMFGELENDSGLDVNMPTGQTPIPVVEDSKSSLLLQAEHPIVVLCLDCSSSMNATDSESGESRIELVKRYARDFINTSVISGVDKDRIELCVIGFDTNVTILKDFAPMSQISDDFSKIQASGWTATYSALTVAVDRARHRKNELNDVGTSCFKPIIFVVTDGRPEGDIEGMREICSKVLAKYVGKDETGKSKMRLIVCGMPGCDMQEMNALCPDSQLVGLRDTDALEEAFKLLTASVAAVSASVVTDDIHLGIKSLEEKGRLMFPRKQAGVLNL